VTITSPTDGQVVASRGTIALSRQRGRRPRRVHRRRHGSQLLPCPASATSWPTARTW
jgi:hypothetical protein